MAHLLSDTLQQCASEETLVDEEWAQSTGKALPKTGTCYIISDDDASSNFTMDDNPGAGRTLDMLYQWAGRRLERFLGHVANRSGLGPDAVQRRVVSTLNSMQSHDLQCTQKFLPEKDAKKLLKECKRLLQLSQSRTASTQLRALQHITELATTHPALQDVFRAQGAAHALDKMVFDLEVFVSFDDHYAPLLSASRQAMYSVESNDLNRLGKLVKVSLPSHADFSDTNMDVKQWVATVRQVFPYLRHRQFAFLAMRYLKIASPYGPLVAQLSGTDDFWKELCEFLADLLVLEEMYSAVEPELLHTCALGVHSWTSEEIRKDLGMAIQKKGLTPLLTSGPSAHG